MKLGDKIDLISKFSGISGIFGIFRIVQPLLALLTEKYFSLVFNKALSKPKVIASKYGGLGFFTKMLCQLPSQKVFSL